MLRYRVLDQNEFWKDRVLGEKTIQLYEVLNHYSGRCDQLELTLDLTHHHSSNGYSTSAAGELFIVLNSLQVDMANVPAPNSATAATAGEPDAAATPQNRPRQLATISYFPSVPVPATAATGTPQPGTSSAEAAAGEATEPDVNGGTSSAAGATTPGSAATPAANGATSSIEEPLPQGWEMRYDIYGRR